MRALAVSGGILFGFLIGGGGLELFHSRITYWTVLPLAVLYRAAYFVTGREMALALFLASIIIPAVGTLFYVDAFLIHPDPQSGIIFLFVPFYQLVAAVVLYWIAYLSWLGPRFHKT